jgi:hypothetical protein
MKVGEKAAACDFVAFAAVVKGGIPAAAIEEVDPSILDMKHCEAELKRVLRLPDGLWEGFFKYPSKVVWDMVAEVEGERRQAGQSDYAMLLEEDDPQVRERVKQLQPLFDVRRMEVEVHSLGLVIPQVTESQQKALSKAVNSAAFPLFAAWCFDRCGGRVDGKTEMEMEEEFDSDEDQPDEGVVRVVAMQEKGEMEKEEVEKDAKKEEWGWNVLFEGSAERLEESSGEQTVMVEYWLPSEKPCRVYGRIAHECEQALRFVTGRVWGQEMALRPQVLFQYDYPVRVRHQYSQRVLEKFEEKKDFFKVDTERHHVHTERLCFVIVVQGSKQLQAQSKKLVQDLLKNRFCVI